MPLKCTRIARSWRRVLRFSRRCNFSFSSPPYPFNIYVTEHGYKSPCFLCRVLFPYYEFQKLRYSPYVVRIRNSCPYVAFSLRGLRDLYIRASLDRKRAYAISPVSRSPLVSSTLPYNFPIETQIRRDEHSISEAQYFGRVRYYSRDIILELLVEGN